MAAANFDDLLKGLHESSTVTDTDTNYIEITSSRRFVIPNGFEKTIAYEGDVNSQIITFIAPLTSDSHDLSKCTNKKLRWVNLVSGNEGSSVLTFEATEDKKLKLFWAAPAEAFTKAGGLSFSISFFDYGTDGKIAYSWNTAECSELVVGASLEKVGLHIGQEKGEYIPAKDEILIINAERRSIVAPQGYRTAICNYGDVNTSVVYFQIKRHVRGIDVLSADTKITIYSRLGNLLVTNSSQINGVLTKELSVEELSDRDSEGLATIVWKPTSDITNNSSRYTGKFRIQIEIISGDKIWRTSPYDDLIIGESDFAFDAGDLPERDEVGNKITGYIIDGAMNLEDAQAINVAGVVKLRSCSENNHILLNLFELVAVYDDQTGKYRGVKIGTEDQQDSRVAPYVAYGPNTTIPLYGGEIE